VSQSAPDDSLARLPVKAILDAVAAGRLDPDALVFVRHVGGSDQEAVWGAGAVTIDSQGRLIIEP
jgi:hypothetical protein